MLCDPLSKLAWQVPGLKMGMTQAGHGFEVQGMQVLVAAPALLPDKSKLLALKRAHGAQAVPVHNGRQHRV